MAKGNMLQGMARGKVGDVVFSRLNGQQVSRVRNRYPKNPKTNAQLYQRAIMATVMRAYSAGISILDHSFEGRAVGADNQRRFLSLNAKRLRTQMAASLAARAEGTALTVATDTYVVGPGMLTPVPNRYQISEGSLSQSLMDAVGKMAAANEGETIAQYCSRLGLVAGDVFTMCVFSYGGRTVYSVNGATADGSAQKDCQFYFVRLILKASALTSTTVITASTTYGDFFDIDSESYPNGNFASLVYTAGLIVTDNMPFEGGMYCSGVIRSRLDEDLRSTSYMTCVSGSDDFFGLNSQYALAGWKQGAVSVGDSDLILEGGDV